MAEIKDCIGKNVKISKGSITIKSEDGKTSGVVRDIVSLYNLQANKQMEYYQKIRKLGLHGKISIKDCIIADGTMYVFRNIKSNLFHEKYGFISEEEKQKAEETEIIYNTIRTAGIEVIECVYIGGNQTMREYTVSKDSKSGLWYAHMKGYAYIPVSGSFSEKKSEAKEYAKMYSGLPHKLEEIEQRRKEKFQKKMELTEAEEMQIKALMEM